MLMILLFVPEVGLVPDVAVVPDVFVDVNSSVDVAIWNVDSLPSWNGLRLWYKLKMKYLHYKSV